MEELFPKLSNIFNDTIEIREDKEQLLIELKIKKKEIAPGDLGKPNEVKEMIRMFGGVKQEISMDIVVNENTNIITIKMRNKEEFETISTAMKNLWEHASNLLIEASNVEPGSAGTFKDLGDFDENY
ncbi:MAG: hypothetical protein EU529_06755 [Promethearchaeota archaeon]|nr:MAG: hypothetical protein EU529_06755 [Candidatus Lokiarchaeota archaeon]